MAVEDNSEGTRSNASVAHASHISSVGSHSGEHVPKVRKPYTITKQREKWTDEEHERFLEAIKLYGRRWRQIEEYVGTKTAIQIRSHAQKTFSKVAREANEGAEGSRKNISIPPPRPKRKPVHPYPRKSVDTPKRTSDASKIDISASSMPVETKEERQSPTTVLSAVSSETLGSAVSEQPYGGCNSPSSCTTVAHSDEENIWATPQQHYLKNESIASYQLSITSDHEKLQEGAGFADKENKFNRDETITTSDVSFKLFGRTLLAEDTQIPFTRGTGLSSPKSGEEDLDTENSTPGQTFPPFEIDKQISHAISCGYLNVVPFAAAVAFHHVELDGTGKAAGMNSGVPLPWWPVYQGIPFLYHVVDNHNVDTTFQALLRPRAVKPQTVHETTKDDSCTGSSSGFDVEVENGRNAEAVDSKSQSRHSAGKLSSHDYTKGFVPYKRFLADRDVKSPWNALEEQTQKRVRVFL